MDKTKSNSKKKKTLKWIPLVFWLIILTVIYFYIKLHTRIVLVGNPREVTITDFSGNIAMDTRMICIDNGAIVNRDKITFLINGERYTAMPRELVILFDCNKDIDKYKLKQSNSILSEKCDMYYSTTVSSDDILKADSISFKRGDNTLEYFHGKTLSAMNMDSTKKIMEINFMNPSAEGLLQIQNNEILNISGGIIVYYKGKIVGENSVKFIVSNEQFGSTFIFSDLSNLKILLNESVGMAFEGTARGIDGEFDSDGKIISTSPALQKELYVGEQYILVEGKTLNVEYVFDSEPFEMIIRGKTSKARLENIDLLDGWFQFIVSHLSEIIMILITIVITDSVEKAGKEE